MESIIEYDTAFLSAVRQAKYYMEISDDIILVEYIRGLKPDILAVVACKQPKTWEEASRLAGIKELVQSHVEVNNPKRYAKPQFKRFRNSRGRRGERC